MRFSLDTPLQQFGRPVDGSFNPHLVSDGHAGEILRSLPLKPALGLVELRVEL